MTLTLVEKEKLYQKCIEEYFKNSKPFYIELEQTGKLSEASLIKRNKLYEKLLKVRNLLFKKHGKPKEVDFHLGDYIKGKYNKSYIVSIDCFYFNVWRKTGTGFFSLPLQYPIQYFDMTNCVSNRELLDISWMKDSLKYDVSNDEAFVSFIDAQFKHSREGYGKSKKDYNVACMELAVIMTP